MLHLHLLLFSLKLLKSPALHPCSPVTTLRLPPGAPGCDARDLHSFSGGGKNWSCVAARGCVGAVGSCHAWKPAPRHQSPFPQHFLQLFSLLLVLLLNSFKFFPLVLLLAAQHHASSPGLLYYIHHLHLLRQPTVIGTSNFRQVSITESNQLFRFPAEDRAKCIQLRR